MEVILKTIVDKYGCSFNIVKNEDEGYFYWRSVATGDEAESDGPFDTVEDAEAALLASM